MKTSRRGFFGLLVGAVAAVFIKKAPAQPSIIESTALGYKNYVDPAAHIGRHIKVVSWSETANWPRCKGCGVDEFDEMVEHRIALAFNTKARKSI